MEKNLRGGYHSCYDPFFLKEAARKVAEKLGSDLFSLIDEELVQEWRHKNMLQVAIAMLDGHEQLVTNFF